MVSRYIGRTEPLPAQHSASVTAAAPRNTRRLSKQPLDRSRINPHTNSCPSLSHCHSATPHSVTAHSQSLPHSQPLTHSLALFGRVVSARQDSSAVVMATMVIVSDLMRKQLPLQAGWPYAVPQDTPRVRCRQLLDAAGLGSVLRLVFHVHVKRCGVCARVCV